MASPSSGSGSGEDITSKVASTIKSATGTIASSVKPADSELTRWRRTFESCAKVEVDGKKWVTNGLLSASPGVKDGERGACALFVALRMSCATLQRGGRGDRRAGVLRTSALSSRASFGSLHMARTYEMM